MTTDSGRHVSMPLGLKLSQLKWPALRKLYLNSHPCLDHFHTMSNNFLFLHNDLYLTMKVVKARNQKTINLTAVQPIRQGDTSKEAPAEQRESISTTFFRPASFLSWSCNRRKLMNAVVLIKYNTILIISKLLKYNAIQYNDIETIQCNTIILCHYNTIQ